MTTNMSHVYGVNGGVGYGVAGRNDIAHGVGVHGVSSPYGIGAGVLGRSYNIGVSGISFNLYSHRAPGVYGVGRHVGVRGESDLDFGWGVRGDMVCMVVARGVTGYSEVVAMARACMA
jgi:hypothetical protein